MYSNNKISVEYSLCSYLSTDPDWWRIIFYSGGSDKLAFGREKSVILEEVASRWSSVSDKQYYRMIKIHYHHMLLEQRLLIIRYRYVLFRRTVCSHFLTSRAFNIQRLSLLCMGSMKFAYKKGDQNKACQHL